MTLTAPPETAAVAPARRARVARPRVVLIAALVVAALSAIWLTTGRNIVLGGVLLAAAALVVVWATAVAMRRASTVIAPLAVILVVVCNPAVLGVYSTHLDDRVGRMTLSPESGLVFWQQYPGIAGWEAPAVPVQVDTTTLVRTVQSSFREAIDRLSGEYSWSWEVGEVTGVSPVPNGFGGASMFHRIDAPVWSSSDFDGSEAQRTALLEAAETIAAQLALPTVADPIGDVAAGDGVRTWSDDLGGTFRLTVQGSAVSLEFVGGPYFGVQSSLEEYAAARDFFDRLELPEPLYIPELP